MALLIAKAVEKQISVSGGSIHILEGVWLSVNQGETIAILGASGSGKTTLLSLLAGLDVPTRGEVILDGYSLAQLNEDERARHRLGRVGFVFQNFELLAHLNALENVMLPLHLARVANSQRVATDLLAQVGLTHRLKHLPYQLSGGEQQRVAIARAFAGTPKILFADEPTGCLDEQTGKKIIDLLFDLNAQKQITLIFVTHDPKLANRCQRIFLLQQGKLQPSASIA